MPRLIPSLAPIVARSSRLQIFDVEEIGPHDAETLSRWLEQFQKSFPAMLALDYNRCLRRIWDLYLASRAAGFWTRWLRDAHLVLA